MPSRPFNLFVGTSFVIHAAIALSFALPRTEKVGVDTSGETFNLPEPIDTEGVASPPPRRTTFTERGNIAHRAPLSFNKRRRAEFTGNEACACNTAGRGTKRHTIASSRTLRRGRRSVRG